MGTPLRVLIVEDSASDAELLLRELRDNGYDLQYECVKTAEALTDVLDRENWDVVLSGDFDALSGLKTMLARQLDIPFIIVSDAISDVRAIETLRAGGAGLRPEEQSPLVGTGGRVRGARC